MEADRFEREYKQATKRGKENLAGLPKARSARYDRRTGRLVIDLENGATMIVPTKLLQGLENANDKELAKFELVLDGSQIHWTELDVQMYVKSLIEGVFGTRVWMEHLKDHYSAIGGKGGSARSPSKAAASRENGKKGGRPRKSSISG
jgi:hypothetical protein